MVKAASDHKAQATLLNPCNSSVTPIAPNRIQAQAESEKLEFWGNFKAYSKQSS